MKVHGLWLPYLSLLVALLLASLPWPRALAPWSPLWVSLVLCYWILTRPRRVGIVTAWVVGLLDDVVHFTPLGEHAAILAVLAYVVERWHTQLRLAPMAQQMVFLFVLFVAERILGAWLMGSSFRPALLFLPALVTTLLWPAVHVILDALGRRLRLAP